MPASVPVESTVDGVGRPRSITSGFPFLNLPLEFLGLLALYSLATVAFFWPWIPRLGAALIGPPEDNMQDFWNTYYAAAANRDGFFFTNLLRFPEGTPLYYHSFAYPKVFAVALVSWLVGTELSALVYLHNLSLLVSFPLAAVGAFYLIRHLAGHSAGAFVAAGVFAFNPSHVQHVMHHAHVASIEFIPFFVLAFLLALERRSVFWLGAAIVFYALSALSSWYYLFYIAYFIVFHAVYTAIRNRSWPAGWHLVAPLACIVGAIVALSPLVVPMIAAARRGARVYQGGHDKYVADVLAYVGFPALHVLSSLGEWIYRRVTGNPWEATVYLGLVNLAVIAWLYLGVKDKNTRLLAYTLSGMVLFCILASGDSLHVLGRRTIPMPGQLLSSLPFFGNVRTPSRAIVFVYLFLAIIIGHAGAVAWQLRRRPAIRWGAPIVVALMILDFYPAGALGMTPVSCSSGLLIIRDDPERGFGVLQVASGKRGAYDEGNYFMLQQVCHGRPICDGNVSRNLVRTLRDRLEVTDLQRQRQQLQESRVKYIVMNREVGDLFPWRVDDELRNRYLAVYPIVYDGSDFTIVRVY